MVIGKSVKAMLLELSAQIAGGSGGDSAPFVCLFMACTILEYRLMNGRNV